MERRQSDNAMMSQEKVKSKEEKEWAGEGWGWTDEAGERKVEEEDKLGESRPDGASVLYR